jgi:hypothetical protein
VKARLKNGAPENKQNRVKKESAKGMAEWYNKLVDNEHTTGTLRTYVAVSWNVNPEAIRFANSKFNEAQVCIFFVFAYV